MSHLNLSSRYNGRSNSIRHMSVWKGTAPPPPNPSSLLYPTWCGRASMSSVSASVCNTRSLSFTRRRLLLFFFNFFFLVDMWFGRLWSPTRRWSDIALLVPARPLSGFLFPNGRVPLTASNESLIVASILQRCCVWAHSFLFVSAVYYSSM